MARLAAAEKAAASAKEEVERLKQAHETLAAKNKQLFDQARLGSAPTRPHGRSHVKQIHCSTTSGFAFSALPAWASLRTVFRRDVERASLFTMLPGFGGGGEEEAVSRAG